MILEVLKAFNLDGPETEYSLFGGGLINNTWKVSTKNGDFILQQINTDIFTSPEDIIENIVNLKSYLHQTAPEYLFVGPIQTNSGQSVLNIGGYTFRIFPFVPESITIDKVVHPNQAYQAAKQFGQFSRLLKDFDVSKINFPLRDFHNLSLRVAQYRQALKLADESRLSAAAWAIQQLAKHMDIAQKYDEIIASNQLKVRIYHHDTKISNVLLHRDTGLGICVIDLDTVMPGHFISDVGDMMRTYLSPVTEEETDFSLIDIRVEIFEAIYRGYMSEMDAVLTSSERELFIYAGQFIIFMQALRFLTDFLNGDIYYGATYPEQNLNRAKNQIHLLNKYTEKIAAFEKFIAREEVKQAH